MKQRKGIPELRYEQTASYNNVETDAPGSSAKGCEKSHPAASSRGYAKDLGGRKIMDGVNGRVKPYLLKTKPHHRGRGRRHDAPGTLVANNLTLKKQNKPYNCRDRRPRLSVIMVRYDLILVGETTVIQRNFRPARPPTRSRMTARGGCAKDYPLVEK